MFDTEIKVETTQAAEKIAMQRAMAEHKGKLINLPRRDIKNDGSGVLVWSGLVTRVTSSTDYDGKEYTFIDVLGQRTVETSLTVSEARALLES